MPDVRLRHVANGTSVTMGLEAAGVRGPMSIWADPLHEGPVPGGITDEQLQGVRARHLGGGPEEPVDEVIDLRQWRAAILDLDSYDELVLWYEHDLFDQLNLIQLLSWIRERVPPTTPVSLICVDSFPGYPDFKGLGELEPPHLASLLEARRPVSGDQYDLADRAWHAFRQSSPEPLDDLRRSETGPLPFLAAAITRFLQEYPWTTDGLARSERRLLELASDGGMTLAAAFPRMNDGERVYYMTDLSLEGTAGALSRTSPPLLAIDVDHPLQTPLAQTRVAITDDGRAVLSRRQDRIALCGIDRWLGGVHLQGNRDVWRWDDESQSVTRR